MKGKETRKAGRRGGRTAKFAVIIEKAERNFSAYLPDVPGCVATAPTRADVLRRIRSALAMHIEGLKEDGQRIPRPSTKVAVIDTD